METSKDKNPFKDPVLVAVMIILIGAELLAYYAEVTYSFVPVWFYPIVASSISVVVISVSAVRGRKLNPHMFDDLKRGFCPSTAVHGTVGKVEYSVLFYSASIFLGLIGGFAGYLSVRERNRPMANLLLLIGTVSTIVYVDIIAGLLLKAAPAPPPPP